MLNRSKICGFLGFLFLYSCASSTLVTPIGNLTFEPSLSPSIGVETVGQAVGLGFRSNPLLVGDGVYLTTDQNLKNLDQVADNFFPEPLDSSDLEEIDAVEYSVAPKNHRLGEAWLIEDGESDEVVPEEYMPEPVNALTKQKELTLLAMCVYGESRSEPYEGKLSIAYVVMNRVKEQSWYGKTVKDVLLKPYQFSCFLKSDPNFKKLFKPKPDLWKLCFKAAWNAYSSMSNDPTLGSNHYCRYDISPPWRKIMEKKKQIGNHVFYKSSPQAVLEWWYAYYPHSTIPKYLLIDKSLRGDFLKFQYLVDEYQFHRPSPMLGI